MREFSWIAMLQHDICWILYESKIGFGSPIAESLTWKTINDPQGTWNDWSASFSKKVKKRISVLNENIKNRTHSNVTVGHLIIKQ